MPSFLYAVDSGSLQNLASMKYNIMLKNPQVKINVVQNGQCEISCVRKKLQLGCFKMQQKHRTKAKALSCNRNRLPFFFFDQKGGKLHENAVRDTTSNKTLFIAGL